MSKENFNGKNRIHVYKNVLFVDPLDGYKHLGEDPALDANC